MADEPAPSPEPEPEPEVEPEQAAAAEQDDEDESEDEDAPAAAKKQEGRGRATALPRLAREDILPEDGDTPMGGGFDTDQDDTTAASQFVFVQHPITKRIARQRQDDLERDRGRKADRQRKLEAAEGVAAGVDSGRKVIDAIGRVTATGFLLCQSTFAGAALLLLVMSAASESFVEYYSPLASTARKVTMFLTSLCILGSVEKHGREAAAGWHGSGWARSAAVIFLYCSSFLLTLLNTLATSNPHHNLPPRNTSDRLVVRSGQWMTCSQSPTSASRNGTRYQSPLRSSQTK